MKNSKISQFIFIILCSLLLFSFSNVQTDRKIRGQWQVVSMIPIQSNDSLKAEESFILEFAAENFIKLTMESNVCDGEYLIAENGKITFKLRGCEFVCCRSEFARSLYLSLTQMDAYFIDENLLTLTGEGKIFLKQVAE